METPSFEKPGMLPMVVLAGGGFGTSTDGACRPDHLRRRAGKWLGKLELGYRKPGQYQPVHSGSDSISVTANNTSSSWQALYLGVSAMNTSGLPT